MASQRRVDEKEVEALVLDALRGVLRRAGKEPVVSLSGTTVLSGPAAGIDSLGLVSLVADLELAIEQRYGIITSLSDELDTSKQNSALRTVASLVTRIQSTLDESAVQAS